MSQRGGERETEGGRGREGRGRRECGDITEKNIGVQVVGSKTIGEYRLMGFNDLCMTIESDLRISTCMDLYRLLIDFIGTSKYFSCKSIYLRVKRAQANIWNGRILTMKVRSSLLIGDKSSRSYKSSVRS